MNKKSSSFINIIHHLLIPLKKIKEKKIINWIRNIANQLTKMNKFQKI